MRCVLHIGLEKTGTTYIQNSLYENASELYADGVYLPERLGISNNWKVPSYFKSGYEGYNLKKIGVESNEEKKEYFKDFFDDFMYEVKNARNCDNFLITSEHFHSSLRTQIEIDALKSFLDQFFSDYLVICYFREQSALAKSLYSTHLKSGATNTFDSFLETVVPENYYYNFLQIAKQWAQAFGADNCCFRVYDHSAFIGKDIFADFLHAIGVASFKSITPIQARVNHSLSPMQCILLRKLNEIIPHWNDKRGISEVNKNLKEQLLNLDFAKKAHLDLFDTKPVYQKFEKINTEFEQKYLPDARLPLLERAITQPETKYASGEVVSMLLEIEEMFLLEVKKHERVKVEERPAALKKIIDVLDYKVHKWISETSLAPAATRKKFQPITERRRAKLMRKYNSIDF